MSDLFYFLQFFDFNIVLLLTLILIILVFLLLYSHTLWLNNLFLLYIIALFILLLIFTYVVHLVYMLDILFFILLLLLVIFLNKLYIFDYIIEATCYIRSNNICNFFKIIARLHLFNSRNLLLSLNFITIGLFLLL